MPIPDPAVPARSRAKSRSAHIAAILLLVSVAAGCASFGGPRATTHTPTPIAMPDSAEALAAWVQPVESVADLSFTPDASIVTPAGVVFGKMAVQSFAEGTLQGMPYAEIDLARQKVFTCADRVVVVEGAYAAVLPGGKQKRGRFAMRATVGVDGSPRVGLLHLGKDLPRVAVVARGCQQLGLHRYAFRSAGVALFGPGWVTSMTGRNAFNEMKVADWTCPQDSVCVGAHRVTGRLFAEAYARLRRNVGVQLTGGRLWVMRARGYRIAYGDFNSGPVTLVNAVDVLAATAYYEWRNLRIAAGPALIRSSWYWDANIERAEGLGFNGARKTFVTPALLGSATYALPITSRIALDMTAVVERSRSVMPPAILEFQPRAVSESGAIFAVGLGVRP